MTDETMQIGTVKYFDFKKKFGFITPDADEDDIFVHFSNISGESKVKRLRQGDRVQFASVEGEQGKRKAVEVSVLQDGDTFGNRIAGSGSPAVQVLETIESAEFAHDLATIDKSLSAPSIITIHVPKFQYVNAQTGKNNKCALDITYEPCQQLLDHAALNTYLDNFKTLSCDEPEGLLDMIYQDLNQTLKPYSIEVSGKLHLEGKVEAKVTIGPDNHQA